MYETDHQSPPTLTSQDGFAGHGKGLVVERRFTQKGVHPFDAIEWEIRDAVIGNPEKPAFEQYGVEFPKSWSQNSTNIVAQKYFRGKMNSPERENSVKQMIGRVAGTIAGWGRDAMYFASPEDADAFEAELTYILLHQVAAFNSPVWFNVGFEERPQCSACFILSVQDTMESILDWNTKEGQIFRGGSGAGINLSNIRGSMESLSKGGSASGPVSFMRGADSWAGTIKSGGKTRRAAKMVVLDVDHPDILDFVWCKAKEEDKAEALRNAGFDMSIDGDGFTSIQYQNANNSVRVTDEFMQAVENDGEWNTIARADGRVVETFQARDLMNQIAEAAWRCADPGVQYDTTINDWHTCPVSGRINASNPCCFVGDTLVRTIDGRVTRFDELYEKHTLGEELPLVYSYGFGAPMPGEISKVWIAGMTDRLVEVRTAQGSVLRCTPEHRFLTADGNYVEAQLLVAGVQLRASADAKVTSALAHGGGGYGSVELTSTVDEVVSVEGLALGTPVPVYDMEVPNWNNFTVTSEEAFGTGVVVHNSEYMHVDDSACNLASINLMKFRRTDGSFDAKTFEHVCDVMLLAQEMVVSPSSYPTKEIGDNARAFRQLGLGYANLGALLMSNGLPYDSGQGRAEAAAITAIMTGRAYRKSAEIAEAVGTYERYPENAEAHMGVMKMHRAAAYELPEEQTPDELIESAHRVWDDVIELGERHGFRNAQATVLAPTGTISFLMDCDTTGVEPDFSLVKFKELVGGGSMTIVNRTVPMALRTLGYNEAQIDQIEAHINEQNTIIGAPELKNEHLPVFDVAVGQRAISHMGHIKMMGAVQPFISGAISKTVNLPQTATVGDIAEAYVEAWRLGVKALAIYRDGSKTAQALRTDAQTKVDLSDKVVLEPDELEKMLEQARAEALVKAGETPHRRRMPRERQSITHKFSIAGHEGYITAGKYEDGNVGEIFLTDIGKEGSTMRGMMNAFATSISVGLQYGVPLETFVNKFSYMRFEPEGITQNPEIPFAKSMPDYFMRWLASRFLDAEAHEELGIMTAEVRAKKMAEEVGLSGDTAGPVNGSASAPVSSSEPAAAAPIEVPEPAAGEVKAAGSALTDTPPVVPAAVRGLELGPACQQCGGMMQRTGSCYTCSSCGNNTGCG